jgi:hypothetical protein
MVDAQSNFRVNDRTKYRSRGFGTPSVSVGLSHAHVCREKKPPTKVAKLKPAAAVAPPIAKPPSPVGRLIASYDDFISVCRDRADELEMSRLEIDHISGLSTGYASILLMKTPRKNFGPISLPLMLDVLGIRLLVVEDPKLTARTLKRRTKRLSSHAHYPRQLPAPNHD